MATADFHAVLARLESDRCLHADDLSRIDGFMEQYHRRTTLHCDRVWRRSSGDGLWFPGPGEAVLDAASVADVAIDAQGRHLVVANDLTPGRLAAVARDDPARFWRQGLVGYGGLALWSSDGGPFTEVALDLRLPHLMEAVDPDLAWTPEGLRMAWFGVAVPDMNPQMDGPLASAMPHRFYRAVASPGSFSFEPPQVAVASRAGSTGGADPTILDLPDGEELLLVGPLDHTVMGWRSVDGERWDADASPSLDTRVPGATPDAAVAPDGGLRLYHMVNGQPGLFGLSESADGETWSLPVQIVMRDAAAFNISVAVDPSGTWWAYYNVTDEACLAKWGSRRIAPVGPQQGGLEQGGPAHGPPRMGPDARPLGPPGPPPGQSPRGR